MQEIKKAVAVALAIAVSLAFFAFAASAQSTNEAVCKLYRGNRFSGSGTLIGTSPDGAASLVISCYHVCRKSPTFDCVFANAPSVASQRYKAQVFKLSSQWDLAALVLQNPGIPPAAIGDFTVRHPGIYSACGYGGGKYSAARGDAIKLSGPIIQTRCGIYGGHSGGGLFDPFGRWCGVTNLSTNSRSPMVNGVTKSRTGEPLQQFVAEAFAECGPFKKLFNRGGGGGGGGDCPGGVCPDPNLQGGGYGFAPGYTPLTPLASQPQAQQPAQTLVTTPGVTVAVEEKLTPADEAALLSMAKNLSDLGGRIEQLQLKAAATQQPIAPENDQPAPVPQPQKLPVEPAPVEADRLARLESMMAKIAGELGVDVETTEQDESGKLLATLPVVELSLKYPDGTSKAAVIDLRSRVLKEFGADEPQAK